MEPQLKLDHNKRSDILRRTLALAEKFYAQQRSIAPGLFVPNVSMDDLKEKGIGGLAALDFFEEHYSHLIANSTGPRYFGFVTGGSTPAAVAADWLVSVYDQNACGSNDSVAPQLEHQAIHYFKQLFGLHAGLFGSFVTGATMANFVGLALGRQWLGEQYGVDAAHEGLGNFPLKIVSATPHSSILKSLSMLGIGRNAMHRIDTLPEREAIDVTKLEEFLVREEKPVIVVGNAGTVNSGDFDDLNALAELKRKHNFWLHIDGAFGGFAACSPKFRHLMSGVTGADSLTIDAHKWLNVPYDAAMQFTRHPSLQLKVFQNSAAYLSDPYKSPDLFHYTPESSRRWRGLPAWFSLQAYGREGISEIVERNCASARHFGEKILKSEQFLLLSPVRLNIVCFTLRHADLDFELVQSFLNAIRDDGKLFFTPTLYKGTPAIRAAVSNWQTEPADMDVAFEVVSRIWNEQLKSRTKVKTVI